jgi:transposase
LVTRRTARIGNAEIGSSCGGVSPWLLKLLERKPRKVPAVALANKMARIIWAMLTSGESYRAAAPVVS